MSLDVVVVLLQHLFNTDKPTFLTCLRTCSSWYDIGIQQLWRDIVVDMYNEDSLRTQGLSKLFRRGCDKLVRTQSLRINYSTGYWEAVLLNRIFAKLPTLSALTVVSLESCIDIFGRGRNYDATFMWTDFLTALPKTVKHLELNEFCLHTDDVEGEVHICDILASLLPQLQSLRIGKTSVCPRLFEKISGICPLLEEVIFNNADYYVHAFNDYNIAQLPSMQHLVDRAHEAAKIYMPALKKMLFYGKYPLYPYSHDKNSYRYAFRIDVVNEETQLFPILVETKYDYNSWIRCPQNPGKGGPFDSSEDVTGKDICNFIEQPSTWITSIHGVRLPHSFHAKRDYIWEESEIFKPNDEVDLTDVWSASGYVKLLYWERKLGRPLLSCQVHNQIVVDPPLLVREVPDEEVKEEAERAARGRDARAELPDDVDDDEEY